MPARYDIQMASGRSISLAALNQSRTYEGLLEGVPTDKMNKRHVDSALKKAHELWKQRPYLIPPVETPIKFEREYPFGVPAEIPGITCFARFRSHQPVGQGDYSELTLVWFQSEFALPIDEEILVHICAMDWNKHATDYEW
jgi:hypothetical protein